MDQLGPRNRKRCTCCKKRKETKYMDQLGPIKWKCKNCNDENRRYGRNKASWRSTKINQI